MEKVAQTAHFSQIQNIVLEGFDLITAYGFTQVPNFILKNPELSSNAKVVYSMLLSYAWHNDKVFPGQERMAEDMGSSQPTIARAIAELEKVGYLEITRRGQGLTNLYTLRHTVKKRIER